MAEGVTGKSVEGKKADIDRQHERAYANAEAAIEEERTDRVVPEKRYEENCKVEEVAMDVLQDKRESSFASIVVACRLTDGTGRWVEEESAVKGLAVVIASGTKTERAGENQKCGRVGPPMILRVNKR